MNGAAIVRRMAAFPAAVNAAVAGLSEAEARWKPPSGNWSVLEVCAHLLDEEREDFRPRLISTLRDAAAPWPALELDKVAERRGYNAMSLRAVLDAFESERAASVAVLGPLVAEPSTNWDATHHHPRGYKISAGALLAAWSAHDALHLRQIAKRLYELAALDGDPHPTAYAGDWTA